MQVLRAVINSGSVTAAATNLGYTPSAVSQQVAALEKEAGVALLERIGRGVRPTAAGLMLSEHAATIGRNVAEAETALADLRAGRTGRLVLNYFTTAGAPLVAPAIARFRQGNPRVRVELRLSGSVDPLPELMQGGADLALVVRARHGRGRATPQASPPPSGVRLVPLLEDAYAAVLPANHRHAEKDVLDLTDLIDEPWIGSEPPGPCLTPILEACAAAGFVPDFVVESEDYATAQGFVAAGLGVGVMPRLGIADPHPGVTVLPLRNPEPVRVIHAAARETSLCQPAGQNLLDALLWAAHESGATGYSGRAEPGAG